MSNFSATFAPNRCVLANTGGTFIPIGCCQNSKHTASRERRDVRKRARETPCAALGGTPCKSCKKGGSAAKCRRCR